MRSLPPVSLSPPAKPPLWAYAVLVFVAGPFLLCVANRRRGTLVDLFIAPWAADLFALLAVMAAVPTAALVLMVHLRRRAAGADRSPLRIAWETGLFAALAWALMQVSVPAFLALTGLPATQIDAQVQTKPLHPTRRCPHLFALDPAPASILSMRHVCAASAAEAARIAASTTPTAPVILTGWGNPLALIYPTATLARQGPET